MEIETVFLPARQKGLIIHAAASLVLLAGSGLSLWASAQQKVGSTFLVLLTIGVLLIPPLLLVAYRGYALSRASYKLDRNALHLSWGLHGEEIPLSEIEWVRPANEMGFSLPLPLLPMPGALLGSRRVEGLGTVVFLASETDSLLLVATPQQIFAISPEDPAAFLKSFQRTIEMGSLSQIDAYSSRPGVYIENIWADRKARFPILIGSGLTAALFILVVILVPSRSSISLGYTPSGLPVEPGPPEMLLLLPVLCILTYLMDLIAGFYLYRSESNRPAAYLILTSTIITPVLLLIAVLLML